MSTCRFQSAPPVKGATIGMPVSLIVQHVSIRAPREGGDPRLDRDMLGSMVSIRAPREGGDWPYFAACGNRDVSIRAPREGGDGWNDLI